MPIIPQHCLHICVALIYAELEVKWMKAISKINIDPHSIRIAGDDTTEFILQSALCCTPLGSSCSRRLAAFKSPATITCAETRNSHTKYITVQFSSMLSLVQLDRTKSAFKRCLHASTGSNRHKASHLCLMRKVNLQA